jgi:uncharacterized protein (DUF58 family)
MNKDIRQTFARFTRTATRRSNPDDDDGVQMESRRYDALADIMSELWILLLVTVFITGIVIGQPWVVAVTVMTGVIALGARIWARLALEEVEYSRTVSQQYLFPGETTELTLTIENKKPIPIPWLRVRDEIPVELEAIGATTMRTERADSYRLEDSLSVAWYERVRHRFQIRALRRGYVRLGPGQLEAGDLFGLFRSHLRIRNSQPIIVYPNVVPMPEYEFPAGRPQGDILARRRLFEDTNRPAGLREYIPGDPIRRIDWKTTARIGSPFVRIYDHTVDQFMVVLLDATTASRPWEGFRTMMLERSITAAASILTEGDNRGYRLGLVSNGIPLAGAGQLVVPPGANPRQLPALLEALAMVRPIVVRPLSDVITNAPEAVPFGSTIVAISSVLGVSLTAELERLKSAGHPTVAIYVGDEEPEVESALFEIRREGQRFDVKPLARTGETRGD